jgi:hypothetical protein
MSIPEDLLVELFLFNPTLIYIVKDKKLALKRLKNTPNDTAFKSYLIENKNTLKIFELSLKKGDSLFYKMMERQELSDTYFVSKLMVFAGKYNRKKEIEYITKFVLKNFGIITRLRDISIGAVLNTNVEEGIILIEELVEKCEKIVKSTLLIEYHQISLNLLTCKACLNTCEESAIAYINYLCDTHNIRNSGEMLEYVFQNKNYDVANTILDHIFAMTIYSPISYEVIVKNLSKYSTKFEYFQKFFDFMIKIGNYNINYICEYVIIFNETPCERLKMIKYLIENYGANDYQIYAKEAVKSNVVDNLDILKYVTKIPGAIFDFEVLFVRSVRDGAQTRPNIMEIFKYLIEINDQNVDFDVIAGIAEDFKFDEVVEYLKENSLIV